MRWERSQSPDLAGAASGRVLSSVGSPFCPMVAGSYGSPEPPEHTRCGAGEDGGASLPSPFFAPAEPLNAALFVWPDGEERCPSGVRCFGSRDGY